MTTLNERLWVSTTGYPYPAPGDPHAVSTVASTFLDYRDQAHTTYSLLDGIGRSNGSWEGDAAREFHSSLARTLPNLSKAMESFGGAGDAARVFAAALTGLQAQADALRPRLQAAESDVQTLLWSRLSPDPAQRAHYNRAWYARQPLLQEMDHLAAQYDDIVRACATRLHDASDAGIRNSWKTWAAGNRETLEKIADLSGTIAEISGDLAVLSLVLGQPELAAVFKATSATFTVVKAVADAGLAWAEYTTSGRLSGATVVELGEDATSVAFLKFPSPSKKVAGAVARGPLAEQRGIAKAASAARDLDSYQEATANIQRIEVGEEVVKHGLNEVEGFAWRGAKAVAGTNEDRRVRGGW